MYISELFNNISKSYRTEKDDHSVMTIKDLRKNPLTLGQLNKLRLMNSVRKFEHEKKLEKISKQYKPPASTEGGLPSL